MIKKDDVKNLMALLKSPFADDETREKALTNALEESYKRGKKEESNRIELLIISDPLKFCTNINRHLTLSKDKIEFIIKEKNI